jgi:hypothetical protein
MIIKRRTRNQIVDTLHKGVVLACVGATVYGCVLLGLRVHKYFTVTKPQQKLKEIEANKHLLREGAESSDSALQDSAPELKL